MNTYRRFFLALVSTSLAACGGSGGGDNEDDSSANLPTLSVDDVSSAEGDTGSSIVVFTVSLSSSTTRDVSVDFTTLDGEADGTDYEPLSGNLTISAGSTSATVSVSISGDVEIEQDETFDLELMDPTNATFADRVGTATITNDDFPLLSIASSALIEGDDGSSDMLFTVSLDRSGISEVTVDYATSDAAALANEDYAPTTGSVSIPAGSVSVDFTVSVLGDTGVERDEQFVVNLLNSSDNARIATDQATGLIVNDDFPKVSIGPGGVTESDVGTRELIMPVILDAPATDDLTLVAVSSDISATNGVDYVGINQTISISAGDTETMVIIDTIGDTEQESAELFQITLSELEGPAVLDQITAAATIVDNDGLLSGPTLIVSPAGGFEGDDGTTEIRFVILVSEPLSEDLSFDVNTSGLTATNGVDYQDVSTSVNIPAGATSALVTVTVFGDTEDEDDEFFSLTISNVSPAVDLPLPTVTGSIADDDVASEQTPRLTIGNASVLEGDAGTVEMIFEVTLDQASTTIVTADFDTEDGSALAGVDYTTATGQISIPIGETAARISVSAIGDTFSEDDETLRVRLSNLMGDAQFERNLATGTILTDEALVRLSIADAGGTEGDTANTEQQFIVSIDGPALNPVSFDFATVNDTAVAGDDYFSRSGSLQIAAGDLSAEITVTVIADEDNEPDETYSLTLTNVSTNAVVTDDFAVGTIVNDDGSPGWQAPISLGSGGNFRSLSMDRNGNAAASFTAPTNASTFENDVMVSRLSAGAWLPAEPVGSLRVDQTRIPQVAMLDNGRILATWVDASEAQSAVFTPGGTWEVQPMGLEGGFFVSLAANASGNAIVAWETLSSNPDPSDVLRNRFDAASQNWVAFELGESDDTGRAEMPLVTIDVDGNTLVYWTQQFSDSALSGNYYDFYDATLASWTGPTRIRELNLARNEFVGSLSGGRTAVAAQFGSAVELWGFDPASAIWSTFGTIQSGIAGDSVLPEFAEGGDGSIFVAWLQESTSAMYDVYVNRFDPLTSAWGAPVLLENLTGTANPSTQGLHIAADDAGNAIVVWSQNIAPAGQFDSRIRASRYDSDDQVWSSPEQIDDDDFNDTAIEPLIEMNAAGNAVVTWYYTGSREIGATRFVAE